MITKEQEQTIKNYIKEFEEKTQGKVIYCTVSGSKLYGTDTPSSDLDVKGLFIPSLESLILKKDLRAYNRDSNKSNIKNSKDDIDFTLHSIHQFFELIQKSETGTIDMYFSMFGDHNIVYQDEEIVSLLKSKKDIFMNRNMKSFIGYALGQAKRFGIKGARYDELNDLVHYLETLSDQGKLVDYKTKIEKFTANNKYIKYVMAPGPRTAKYDTEIEYLSVLSKLFSNTLEMDYFKSRVKELYNQFGNRTISTSETKDKVDYKAISHSLRIAQEVQELLETGNITFPLRDREYIRDIKEGKADFDTVIGQVEDTLNLVDSLLETTELPEQANKEEIEKLLLYLIKGQE